MVAIVGSVGSGKSSLLSSLLAQVHLCEGTVRVKGTIAYTAQQVMIRTWKKTEGL
jgi:ABC-type phosphate/phosphonate transport system ATPase subunit